MASLLPDDRYYIAVDATEMDKIDKVLRLTGLKFSKNNPVLGKKKAGLMLALGAFDTKRSRAGNQLVVVRRLCVLYDALLSIHKDHPALDITSSNFYEAAIDHISKKHKEGIAKYLTPSSLQHVIELYRKAFHYGGLRPKKPNAKKGNSAQETAPTQSDPPKPDVSQPNNNGGEASIGEALREPPKPLDPIGDRVTLEKLVTEWIIVCAIARRNEATAEEPEAIDSPHPEQPHDESAKAQKLSLQKASEYYQEKESTQLIKERNTLLDRKCELLEKKLQGVDRVQDIIGSYDNEIGEIDLLLSVNDERQGQLNRRLQDRQRFLGGPVFAKSLGSFP